MMNIVQLVVGTNNVTRGIWGIREPLCVAEGLQKTSEAQGMTQVVQA
jgi:hypothetical protein